MAKERTRKQKITRRAFIISGSIIGGGFALGLGGSLYSDFKKKKFTGRGFEEGEALNPFIFIKPDNTIQLAIARAEMGQGVLTALAMLTAEELEVSLDQIEVVHPQVESPYANINLATNYQRTSSSTGFHFMEKVAYILPYIATGGSTSVRDGYLHYRQLGAMALDCLYKAAQKEWGLATSSGLSAKEGYIERSDGNKLSYGSLAKLAAQEKPSNDIVLKSKEAFSLVGKPTQRIDLKEKVNGSATFGIDVRVPDMLFAAVKHSPVKGAEVLSVNNEQEVLALRGVKKVIHWSEGAAVVADNTWRAQQAANKLELTLDTKRNGQLSTDQIRQALKQRLNGEIDHIKDRKGRVDQEFEKAAFLVEAEYEVPFLAHATMEPLNCTILVKEGKAKVWVGHQAPFLVSMAVASEADVKKSDIEIDIKYLGGGFGRRAENDFAIEAAKIAKSVEGTPVQMVWSREEDTQNDTYRPMVLSRFKAWVDEFGRVGALENHIAMQSVLRSSIGRNFPLMTPPESQDTTAPEGAAHLAYDFTTTRIGYSFVESPMRLGFWRSVGHSYNAFFTESFIDEMAFAINKNSYWLRRKLLRKKPRQLKVLGKAVELSQWASTLPKGKAQGLAFHESFGSIVAQVVEVTVNAQKEYSLDKVYCVIDCGHYVNPDTIHAQMQSGIVYAFTAAAYGEITLKDGKIEQSNFPNYDMIRLRHMPEVISHIMENDEDPGGVGEPSTPPLAPALTNAIFAANGDRIRSLPLSKHGYKLKSSRDLNSSDTE
ncbi:MAG: xanthine dehydrogenase family protein molybdopterin-binding subunit [Roseivirga sp.]|nr:xanthine dehydrogenase family protein molybdopterin-binding subunit [Roseivirga sp.]